MATRSSPQTPLTQPTAEQHSLPQPPRRPAIRGPLRRLLFTAPPAYTGFALLWGAIPGILLPLQVEAVDPAHKAGNLGIVTAIGALAAMFAQPLAGALSDRTRSRLGRRGPWIVGGSLIGGLALLGMAAADSLVQIVIAWICVQIAYNFVQGPLTAVMPDRVPAAVRGSFSAAIGFASMLGAMGGQLVGSGFVHHIGAGYVVIAGVVLVALSLFVLLNPDQDNRGEERGSYSFAEFLRSFWFNPRAHPDLGWAFLGRLLLYMGYFLITNYQLYMLQDYIGLKDKAVSFVPALGVTMLAATLLATAAGGPLSDRFARRKIFVFAAAVVMSVALLVPWALPTKSGMLVYALLAGLGFGLYITVDQALVTEVLPAAEDVGKDLGIVNIAATLPQVIAPAAAGAITVGFGYGALFPFAIVCALAGGLAVIPIKGAR